MGAGSIHFSISPLVRPLWQEWVRNSGGAVVRALTWEHKVAGGRLTAFGAGMAAPAAPNTSDAERARNRRVELVPR